MPVNVTDTRALVKYILVNIKKTIYKQTKLGSCQNGFDSFWHWMVVRLAADDGGGRVFSQGAVAQNDGSRYYN